jgi:uncharacterized membrane protein HdeD (DUF308 family)
LDGRNKGLIILGIVLLVVGLFASFYKVSHIVGQAPAAETYQISYPYQIVGIIKLVVGITFISLGFLFQHKKTQH